MGITRITVDDHGLAVVFINDSRRTINTVTLEFISELEGKILPLIRDAKVRALVIISEKSDNFIAGADIKLFAQAADGATVARTDARFSRALTELSNSSKPVVAAVHGPALGGGLELALACHYILASSHPITMLGLPEVTLGLSPGAGGTQRLPRRVGLIQGMNLMLTGRRVSAAQALELGLVDEVVPRGQLAYTAAERAGELVAGRARPKPRRPTWQERIITLPLLKGIFFKKVRKATLERTREHYPAPLKIIDCVEAGLRLGMPAALELEAQTIGELSQTPTSRNLVWLFMAGSDLRDQHNSYQARLIKQLGIIGAGLMGTGIALVSMGLSPVKITDQNQEALDRCQAALTRSMDRQVASGVLTPDERDRRKERLSLSADRFSLAGSDLVVEAVWEDLELKQKMLAQAEEFIAEDTVYASCTSSLPISDIAAQAKHPERVVGMHYFSPVSRMMLMELVAPSGAADWALATARAFATAQGKTIVVVADRPGFYTTRILTAYLLEAVRILQSGHEVGELDQALADFGFALGPAALMDAVGLATVAQVAGNLGQAYAGRWGAIPTALGEMAKAGLTGRRGQAGFYSYPTGAGQAPKPNPRARQIMEAGGIAENAVPGEPAERCLLAMANEAAWCLEQGVIAGPRDGDLAAVLGVSFPAFRGGPFHYLDALGLGRAVSLLESLADSAGARFEPAPVLHDLARKEGSFFSR